MPIFSGTPAKCSELSFLRAARCVGAVSLVVLGFLSLASCSWMSFSGKKDTSPPFSIYLSLDKAKYLPGEPILAHVELKRSLTGKMDRALQPDHETVRFLLRPDREGGEREITYEEPVYSPQEPTKQWTEISPGKSIPRRFLFTVLTFERGSFALAAEYEVPDPKDVSKSVKIYSPPALFKVEGQKAFARRYRNGLLYREDALDIAKKSVQGEVLDAKCVWAVDEKGFLKWWVNVRCRGADNNEETRSFWVDPYLARAEKASRPFEPKEEDFTPPFPRDSKRVQDLREKARAKASAGAGQAGPQAAPAAGNAGQASGAAK
jgi:hypothetical protein